ncbi:MAG: hypothetical protein JWP68_4083 [Modestobacter sp.]|nr:hypothetical protein [Modestobacter sp.]
MVGCERCRGQACGSSDRPTAALSVLAPHGCPVLSASARARHRMELRTPSWNGVQILGFVRLMLSDDERWVRTLGH